MRHLFILALLASFLGACGDNVEPDISAEQDNTPGSSSGGSSGGCTGCSNGCCDGDTCIPFSSQTTASCGAESNSCMECEFGEMCSQGQCVVDQNLCSPLTCTGCCADETTCVAEDHVKWDACGRDAAACQTCDYGAECSIEGQCTDTIDRRAVFLVTIETVELAETQLNGSHWDLLGNAPEPYVCVSNGEREVCTEACSDSFTCNFSSRGGATTLEITGASLANTGLTFTVYDEDLDGDDLAGRTTVTTNDLLAPGESYVIDKFLAVETLVYSLRPKE